MFGGTQSNEVNNDDIAQLPVQVSASCLLSLKLRALQLQMMSIPDGFGR